MGESLSTWMPSCNGSVRVELDGQRTTSDSGALWQLACSDARGMTPLAQDRPSQATLSRLLTSLKNGERPKQLTLDIDGLPVEVHGHQGGSAYHGLYGARIYSPLVASLAETGDMVGGLLREGNAGPAENADT